jgi:hypothetical protein
VGLPRSGMRFQELSKIKTSSVIGKQFTELIRQIPSVQQTINARPTNKHGQYSEAA